MKNRQRGQSFTEMAISLAIIITILSLTVDLGRVFFTQVAIEDAAGEAALYYAVSPDCMSDGTVDGVPVIDNNVNGENCDAPMNALWRAQNATNFGLNWNNPNNKVTATRFFINDKEYVLVKIEYNFVVLSPLVSAVVGNNIILSAEASEQLLCSDDECFYDD